MPSPCSASSAARCSSLVWPVGGGPGRSPNPKEAQRRARGEGRRASGEFLVASPSQIGRGTARREHGRPDRARRSEEGAGAARSSAGRAEELSSGLLRHLSSTPPRFHRSRVPPLHPQRQTRRDSADCGEEQMQAWRGTVSSSYVGSKY